MKTLEKLKTSAATGKMCELTSLEAGDLRDLLIQAQVMTEAHWAEAPHLEQRAHARAVDGVIARMATR